MQIVKYLLRFTLSVLGGWYSLYLLYFAIKYLSQNDWGLFHTGLPIIWAIFFTYVIFKLLGTFKFFGNVGNEQNIA